VAFTIGIAASREGFRDSGAAGVGERVWTDCKDGGQERDSGTLSGFSTRVQNLFLLDFLTAAGVPSTLDGVFSRHTRRDFAFPA